MSQKALLWFSQFLLICLVSIPGFGQQRTMAPGEFVQWLPISDAEKAQKAPVVDKDAGAEILLWRVHVVDEITGQDLQRVLYHYLRVKVFDEMGKAAMTTVELPYRSPGNILDVSGRTIRPDGSVVEVDGKTIFRRAVAKVGRDQNSVVSFAMPAVEPGAILEYRWKQTQDDNRFRYLRLEFARDLPVQQVTYFVRPLSSAYVATDQMFLAPFNCQPTPMKQTNDGWNETTVTNVAARRSEPYAPSRLNLEPWALLYYRSGGSNDPKKYWADQGKRTYNEMKVSLKASDELKAAAAKINGSAKTDDEKLEQMVTFVHANLKDFFDLADADRNEFLKKLPKDRDRTSAEILKSGAAFSQEMNVVFAALAAQVGFDARPVMTTNRDSMDFSPDGLPDRYFLDDIAMAIKLGGKWKVFDVSRRHLKPGMMPANAEGVFALVTDSKTPEFVTTTPSAPEASAERRTATLKLSNEGTLEGDVTEMYSGHRGELYREILDGDTQEQQEKWLKDRITAMFPGAQVTNLKVANLADVTKELEVSYHLMAPLFAQVTGRRILFQPVAFRRADPARFTAADRKHPILFQYGWHEADTLKISLPPGFTLENAENPGNMEFGNPGYYHLSMTTQGQELTVNRELLFGKDGLLLFAVNQYPAMKQLFEQVHVRDTTSFSLRGN